MKYLYLGLIDAKTRQLIGEDATYGNPYPVVGLTGAKIFLKGVAGQSQLEALLIKWKKRFDINERGNVWIHNLTIKEIQISW